MTFRRLNVDGEKRKWVRPSRSTETCCFARFSHALPTCVANNNILEKIRIRHDAVATVGENAVLF
jgi:hypothetical protein